jgi:RNA polymerase sigma-70 factor (ECF subfamily)
VELSLPLNPTELNPVVPIEETPGAPSALERLTRRLRAGDEVAWREFHAEYAPRLLRYLAVVAGGDEDLIRDSLQQTFLRAVRHMRSFESEDSLWSWLTVLARSACIDERRRRGRRAGLLRRWWTSREAEPETVVEISEDTLSDQMIRELEGLPPEMREVLERKYLRGQTVLEIATSLEVSGKTIESRLGRARLELRTRLLRHLRHET